RRARAVPAQARRPPPQSSAARPLGPSLSTVPESAMAPCRLTSPYVGRRPVTPQYAAGVRIEPEVSDPMAKGTSPAATAAPGPAAAPPLQQSGFHGVLPGPVNDALPCRYPIPPPSPTIASF